MASRVPRMSEKRLAWISLEESLGRGDLSCILQAGRIWFGLSLRDSYVSGGCSADGGTAQVCREF